MPDYTPPTAPHLGLPLPSPDAPSQLGDVARIAAALAGLDSHAAGVDAALAGLEQSLSGKAAGATVNALAEQVTGLQAQTRPLVAAPSITSPAAGATGVARQPVITATACRDLYGVAHAATQVQISTTATFATLTADATIAAVTSWTCPTTLAELTAYHVRVRYQNADGAWSEWSPSRSFTTIETVIATPSITSPAAGATGVAQAPVIQASAFAITGSSGAHSNSDWQVATSGAFTALVAQSMADATNKTSWQVTAATLLVGTTYWVRVRYHSSDGEVSGWSSPVSFTTAASFGTTSLITTTDTYLIRSTAINGAECVMFSGGGGATQTTFYKADISGPAPNLNVKRTITIPTSSDKVLKVLPMGSNYIGEFGGSGADSPHYAMLFNGDFSTLTTFTLPDGHSLLHATSSHFYVSRPWNTYDYAIRRFNTSGTNDAAITFNSAALGGTFNGGLGYLLNSGDDSCNATAATDGAYMYFCAYTNINLGFSTYLLRVNMDLSGPVVVGLGFKAGTGNAALAPLLVLDNGNLVVVHHGANDGSCYLATHSPTTLGYVSLNKLVIPSHDVYGIAGAAKAANGEVYVLVWTRISSIWYAHVIRFNATMTTILAARRLGHTSNSINAGRILHYNGGIYVTGGISSTPFLLKTNPALGDLTGSLANHAGLSWSNVTDASLASQSLPSVSAISNGITTKSLSNTTAGPTVSAGGIVTPAVTISAV